MGITHETEEFIKTFPYEVLEPLDEYGEEKRAYQIKPTTFHKERMQRLLEVLQKVQKMEEEQDGEDNEFFDISMWRSALDSHNLAALRTLEDGNPIFEEVVEFLHNCGTTCCAFGWAVYDPRNKAEGLYMGGSTPMFEEYSHIYAAQHFYETDLYIVHALFFDDHYKINDTSEITTEHVIEKVEALLADKPIDFILTVTIDLDELEEGADE